MVEMRQMVLEGEMESVETRVSENFVIWGDIIKAGGQWKLQ